MSFDYRDDSPLGLPPLQSVDLLASSWADPPRSEERGTILESQENLRWTYEMLRQMRRETIIDADGIVWEVLARRVGVSTSGAVGDPWTPYEVAGPKIAIRTGLINGTIIPTNANQEVIVPTTLTQFYLELTFSGHNLASARYAGAPAVPANPAPGADFPEKLYYRLFELKRLASGTIDWTSYRQFAKRNFSVASYVANITGEAPAYTVEYGIAFLE